MTQPRPGLDASSEVEALDAQISDLRSRAKPILDEIKALGRRRRALVASARSAQVRAARIAEEALHFRKLHAAAGGDRYAATKVIVATGIRSRTAYRRLNTLPDRHAGGGSAGEGDDQS